MIFVVDTDEIMARCVGRATGQKFRIFRDGIEAMQVISEGELPEMIFLEAMLNGPDGFTFLNELVSYEDTARIPVVLVSALEFRSEDLGAYGVVGVLNKDTMVPEEIGAYVKKYARA